MDNELIERARELAQAATPGPWTAILGSGEHQCTAIMAERPHPLANIFIADLLPDWALREMVVPKDHIPNLNFLEASRELVPALCDALEAAQAENARLREALAEVLRVHDAATSPDLHYHLCPQWRGVHGKCNCGADKAIENARAALEPRP